ncbi:MAG: tRNA (guanosine(46)-N7)-methyltransferase TrmB [Candidatus Kapaibacterium sp.]|jgi:tRNA (guanine-N7-)-methyltransferase|nr:tRNA (guanosine(46)-N7)-methyltransferase TrmB [Candidatus Kapabacteria bacterium]
MTPVNYKKYPFTAKIRHHVSANNYMPVSELKFLPDSYPPLIKEIEWSSIFINSKPPKVLDIGCGKGVFLLSHALLYPDINILGLEIRSEAVDWINSVIKGESIGNCKALYYTVANSLPFIEDNSIDRIFYLFPDPWPKRRHFNRRAFNLSFLDETHRVLRNGGKLYLATDLDYVHDYHLKTLKHFGKFSINELQDRSKWDFPTTNKENFCLKNNIEVYRLVCEKT